MNGLPAPLAEPLHILEPWPWRAIVGAVIATALAVWLLWRWLHTRTRRSEPPPSLPAVGPSDFAAAVEAIRERARESSFFRLGCHELSELLRAVLVARHGPELDHLTARETTLRMAGNEFAELLVQTSVVRFGRRVPDDGALSALCDLALEIDVRESR